MNTVRKLLKNFNRHIDLIENESLSLHTTFKVGGRADFFAAPDTIEDFIQFSVFLVQNNIRFFVLGGGSNLVFSDEGFRGVILSTEKLNAIEIMDETGNAFSPDDLHGNDENEGKTFYLRCGAGVKMADLSAFCADHALKGFAPFAGLPGTAGGACFMNARCYGSEVADVLKSALYFDFETLSVKEYVFSPDDWAYKVSPFQQNGGIILQSTFKVCADKKANIMEESCKNIEDRKQKGHFSYPSAGSVFKNNRNFGMPSGKIIEDAGLKGTAIGGAQIAPWHGNFIINNGNATATQIKELVNLTKAKIEEKTGFQLECEVIFVDN